MNTHSTSWRPYATPAVALVLVLIAFGFSRPPQLDPDEQARLAARFDFEPRTIPLAPDLPAKMVREVHPSLQRISAWVSSLGAAVTLADLDGDGLSNDLILVDPRTDTVSVMPVPGSPERYSSFFLKAAPLPYDAKTTAPMGTLAGDFNEDGRMDMLVYFWGRTPVIFLRAETKLEKPLTSTALAASMYVPTELASIPERWFSNSALQTDLDGDGHVDLLIGNYFQDGAHILDASAGGVETMHEGKAKAVNGGFKHIFLWQSATAGPAPSVRYAAQPQLFRDNSATGWTLAMGAADLDGDLLPELYFAHDFGPDRLLRNRSVPGRLEFVELMGARDLKSPKSCVLGRDTFKGMGVDFGDLNGDGLLDIYVSNIATQFGLTESHFLWQSTGELDRMQAGIAPYENRSEPLGLSRSGWGWDCRLADFDNDGELEAIQAVGFIKGTINRWPELQALGTSNDKIVHDPRFWPSFKPGADLSGHETNAFFVRGSDGRYHNLAPAMAFSSARVSRGIAIADVDGDGRLDFAVANQWEDSQYFHNTSAGTGAYIGLHLLIPVEGAGTDLMVRPGHPGAESHGRPAIGAIATVQLPNGRLLTAQIDGGNGHSGRRSPEIHLGLGQLPPDLSVPVTLRWRDPQGSTQQTQLSLQPGWHTITLGARPTTVATLKL